MKVYVRALVEVDAEGAARVVALSHCVGWNWRLHAAFEALAAELNRRALDLTAIGLRRDLIQQNAAPRREPRRWWVARRKRWSR